MRRRYSAPGVRSTMSVLRQRSKQSCWPSVLLESLGIEANRTVGSGVESEDIGWWFVMIFLDDEMTTGLFMVNIHLSSDFKNGIKYIPTTFSFDKTCRT